MGISGVSSTDHEQGRTTVAAALTKPDRVR